jgi:hypothetical protein
MSFQKSHRAKALASLVESGPSISLDGALQPPKSLAKPKKKKTSGVEGLKGKGSGPSQAKEDDVEMEEASDDEMLIDDTPPTASTSTAIQSDEVGTSTSTLFQPLSVKASSAAAGLKNEMRRIPIPPHRMTPLKKEWVNVYGPLVEMMGLVVRMNVKRRCVEMKVSLPETGTSRTGFQNDGGKMYDWSSADPS